MDRKTVDQETIRHVARLSRLELSDAEMETFTSQLVRIVDYVEKLQELDVSGDEPMAHAAGTPGSPSAEGSPPAGGSVVTTGGVGGRTEGAAEGALLRDDAARESLARKDALEGAPSAGDGFFRVPPVIEDAGASG